jgi:hypothetical protein
MSDMNLSPTAQTVLVSAVTSLAVALASILLKARLDFWMIRRVRRIEAYERLRPLIDTCLEQLANAQTTPVQLYGEALSRLAVEYESNRYIYSSKVWRLLRTLGQQAIALGGLRRPLVKPLVGATADYDEKVLQAAATQIHRELLKLYGVKG